MDAKTLENIGLSKNEIKVYLALLDLGLSLAGRITNKAGMHRRAVYDSLNRLVEKGLVSYVIQLGKKHFEASNPQKLLALLKENESEIKRKEESIQSLLPELLLKYNETKSDLNASIYKGKEGLKTVMELILKEKNEWFTIGSTGKGQEALQYYLEQFSKRREKLSIKRKILVAKTKKGIEYSKILEKQSFVDIKFLPEEIQNPQTIWIFGNKVAIILVSVEQPIVFFIDNKEISKSFQDYFELLWKSAKT